MALHSFSCLCPTFRRPTLLLKAIEYFEKQRYPASRRELLILDDDPDGLPLTGLPRNVRYLKAPVRFGSLPDKYAYLAREAAGDVFAIWEDDDEYYADHLYLHSVALIHARWSKPSIVLSDYADPPRKAPEHAAGRFFASLAVKREFFQEVGGFVMTRRADFDQQFIARLTALAPPGDPCLYGRPQYCFRWHTGEYHGQGYMQGPDDESWYARAGMPNVETTMTK